MTVKLWTIFHREAYVKFISYLTNTCDNANLKIFPYRQCGPSLVVPNHFFPTSKRFQTWIRPCCGLFPRKSDPRGLLRGAPQPVVWGLRQTVFQLQAGRVNSVPMQRAHHLDINKQNAALLSLKCRRHSLRALCMWPILYSQPLTFNFLYVWDRKTRNLLFSKNSYTSLPPASKGTVCVLASPILSF